MLAKRAVNKIQSLEICKSQCSLPMQHNQTVAPVFQTVINHFLWLSGDNKQWCWHWVFFNKAAIKRWEKLALTLPSFVVLLHHCSDCKNCDLKISFIELFHVVCLQWFVMVLQKTVSPFFFFIDVKRLLGMQKPVSVFSTVMNTGLLCITENFSASIINK